METVKSVNVCSVFTLAERCSESKYCYYICPNLSEELCFICISSAVMKSIPAAQSFTCLLQNNLKR